MRAQKLIVGFAMTTVGVALSLYVIARFFPEQLKAPLRV